LLAAAAAWPLVGYAQQAERLRRVGVLMPLPENDAFAQAFVTSFAQALGRLGWVEGKNIRIDYRFAAGDQNLFKTYAADLVGLVPDAILAATPQVVTALQQQTRTIPIVFVFVVDPVGLGIVHGLARPGGNVTGFTASDAPITGKWLQLLKEVAPGVARAAVIFNPNAGTSAPVFNPAIEAAAPSVGMTVTLAPVSDEAGIEATAAAQARDPGGSLISLPDSFTTSHRDVIIAAAARRRLPLVGAGELWPRSGALLSYFTDPIDLPAQAASYIDRIFKGAQPADLPVQQPTKYALVINLKTAKALGLTVPQSILQRADEVIE
jgi:putative ABC transport system substrate-binding protein